MCNILIKLYNNIKYYILIILFMFILSGCTVSEWCVDTYYPVPTYYYYEYHYRPAPPPPHRGPKPLPKGGKYNHGKPYHKPQPQHKPRRH